MLYIYLPVLYYHGNLYVTEKGLSRRAGFSAVPVVFLVLFDVNNDKMIILFVLMLTSLRKDAYSAAVLTVSLVQNDSVCVNVDSGFGTDLM